MTTVEEPDYQTEIMDNNYLDNKVKFFNIWAPFYDFIFTTVIYQAIHQRLLEYVELPPKPLVLDLGCGTGRLLKRMAKRYPDLRGIGLDLSPEMLRQARQKNQYRERIIFKQGNASRLPFADNQFDATFNTISFLHYREPEQVFQEISRVLAGEGYFYLVDYTTVVSQSKLGISPGGLRLYSREKREALGAQANLSCIGHYYLFGSVLLTIFRSTKSPQRHR